MLITMQRLSQNIVTIIPSAIISVLIFVAYSSLYSGRMGIMAPFLLLFANAISFVTCLILFTIESIVLNKLNHLFALLIFVLKSFSILAFVFDLNPFNSLISINDTKFILLYYLSILVPALVAFLRSWIRKLR